MNMRFNRYEDSPLTASRVLDEICSHPAITGVVVVGAALTLGALLRYGPPMRRRRTMRERMRRSLRASMD